MLLLAVGVYKFIAPSRGSREISTPRVAIAFEKSIKSLLKVTMIAQEKSVGAPEVTRAFEILRERLLGEIENLPYDVEILILHSELVNAFAFPGGLIVVFTGLIKQLEAPEEMAAVLAHELGHVVHRDALNQLIRQIGLSTILSLAGGREADLIIQRIIQEVVNIRFSRSVEEKADDYALHLLSKAEIDPVHLANALEHLKKESNKQLEKILKYIDSHPELDSRIQRAREFSGHLKARFTPINIDWNLLKEAL